MDDTKQRNEETDDEEGGEEREQEEEEEDDVEDEDDGGRHALATGRNLPRSDRDYRASAKLGSRCAPFS